MSTPPRRFPCGEADYLTDRGVPLRTAAAYDRRFGPAAIRELYHAGVTPEQANAAPAGLNSSQVIAHYSSA